MTQLAFEVDAVKERYFFLKRCVRREARVDLGTSLGVAEADELRSVLRTSQYGTLPYDEATNSKLARVTLILARTLDPIRIGSWIHLHGPAWAEPYASALPFLGYTFQVRRSPEGAVEVSNGGATLWGEYVRHYQTVLSAKPKLRGLKVYLLLRTLAEESRYGGPALSVREAWHPSQLLASANARYMSADGKEIAYTHVAPLEGEPLGILRDTGSNSRAERSVYPEILPLIRALNTWFEQTYASEVKQHVRP